MIDTYFAAVRAVIDASPIVRASSLTTDRRTDEIGVVRGDLTFSDGSRLHFREYVRVVGEQPAERYTYAYQYQRAVGALIFRYDNTDHYPDLPNAPHHRHGADDSNVVSADPPDLAGVLAEIETHIAVE